MLVLGEKYTFTALELERLDKKFKNITFMPYKGEDPDVIRESITKVLNAHNYTLIVLNTKAKVDNTLIRFLTHIKFDEKFKHIRFLDIGHFLEEYLHKCYIPQDHTDLHYLHSITPYSKFQYVQKRAVDFFGIFWLYLFSFVVMKKCAKRIVEESPGPVYFKQERVGYMNQDFNCVKFRSMHTDTEFFNHYTQKDDPRIFPWGQVMRKRRYDELPQMKNILKGEMHLMGPRAEWNQLVKEYEDQVPYYAQRHIVAPGITGWAQVMYPYGENVEDSRQKLMYDLYYIKHWSLALEFKIIWKTAMVVLHKKGV